MTRRRIPVALVVAASRLATAPAKASISGRATARFKAHLGAVYKARWRHASRRWAACPRAEELPQVVYCMAEFKHRGRWRLVDGWVARPSFRARLAYARSWTRRWRRTPSACARGWGVTGTIFDNDHACNGDMAGDLERAMRGGQSTRMAYVHGTNMAGFGKVGAYRCHRSGVAVTCANAMGDSFRVVG